MDLAQKPVYKLDLAAGTSVVNLTTPLVEGDDRAQTFALELTDKGAPANLKGYSVTAYFGRGKTAEAEADTIPLSGTVSGNVATITLTESCYSRSCYFSMPIRLSNGATGQKRTYLIVRGTVVKSVDGTIIDPDGSVPSLDDLFAQIAVMERSRQAAEEATEEALAAAARADEAREGIQGDLATLTKDIARNTAPPIVPTATGETVTVSDSANRPLAGFRLYGKTTQDGTPTPNSPVPLVNVGAGGEIKAGVLGANYFDKSKVAGATQTETGFSFTNIQEGNAPTVIGILKDLAPNLKAGDNVTFYADVINASIGDFFYLSGSKHDWHAGAFHVITQADLEEYVYAYGKKDVLCEYKNVIITKVANAAYEPYKDGGSMTASTPNGLPGIPVTSDGNYTDKNGQQWICDYKDYARGVNVQCIARHYLDGSVPPSMHDQNGRMRFAWGGDSFSQIPFAYYRTDMQMCNRFTPSIAPLQGNDVNGTIATFTSGEIFLRYDGATSVDAMVAYLAANPVEYMYALATPIETPIPEDEMAEYRAMKAQYPNTTVYNDSGAGMAVDYIADTRNYIDGKLAAIAAATL